MGKDPTSRTLALLVALGLAAWCLRIAWEAILPFLIAFALAAILDPLIDRLQRRRLPRWAAIAVVFAGFFGLSSGAIAILAPLAMAQAGSLNADLAGYVDRAIRTIDQWAQTNVDLLRRFHLPVSLAEALNRYQGEITAGARAVVQAVFGMFGATATRLIWGILVPVVALYALADYDLIRGRALHLLPPDHRATVDELARRVGRVFVSYLRGLLVVCVCLGIATWLLLNLGFHLQYALIIAVLATILYAIPYVGEWTVLAIVALVAWATGERAGTIVAVLLSQLALFQLFDQIITPRVVSGQVGIHPLTGLLALSVGGWVFGLPGMVLAVPVAASLKVVAAHFYPRVTEPVPDVKVREYTDRSFLPQWGRKSAGRGESRPAQDGGE